MTNRLKFFFGLSSTHETDVIMLALATNCNDWPPDVLIDYGLTSDRLPIDITDVVHLRLTQGAQTHTLGSAGSSSVRAVIVTLNSFTTNETEPTRICSSSGGWGWGT